MSFIAEYSKATSAKLTDPKSSKNNPGEARGAGKAEGQPVSRIELIELTEKERPGGEQPIVTITNSFNRAKEDNGRYGEYALRLRRKHDKDGATTGTQLEVRSPIIRTALNTILDSYAFLNLLADPIIIKKPYDGIFHYRKEIAEYTDAPERTTEEREHMKVLTETFFPLYINPIEKIYQEEIPKGRVRFDLLWTLFRAEDDIIVHTEYFREIHRVVHCETKTDKDDNTFFQIHTWRWGYNAGKFGPAAELLAIPEFSGTRRIEQLDCFPVRFLKPEDQKELRRKLVQRGHLWRELIRPSHKHYEGPMWVGPPGDVATSMKKLVVHFTKSRVMLDYKLHVEDNFFLADNLIGANGYDLSTNEPSDSDGYDFWTLRLLGGSSKARSRAGNREKVILNSMRCYEDSKEYVMSEQEAWLCPARARGFSLQDKMWAFFRVDDISDIDFKTDSFRQLEMNLDMKDSIRALVEMHNRTSKDFDDIIAEKGKGVIMSLEGPPGSGKTLTAESVAELTQRPLYSISSGEISDNIVIAESSLRAIFARAASWDAVLLLDEADLFLSKRTTDDMKRNAFVTVFLRLLEYYQGIMFLTSNRVEEFDPAFSSRIHLKVPYKAPDKNRRAAIWKNLLSTVPDCNDWEEGAFERLGRDLDVNGREIKNLIRTSLAIAAYRQQPLSEEILRLVYSINHGGGPAT